VPCNESRPVFSKAQGNEIWVILLEKAWAKIHGSYERISLGVTSYTLRDITGAPSFIYETKNE
jgi:calpain-15